MELSKLAFKYPDLWHVTAAGDWTAVRDKGLVPPGQLEPGMADRDFTKYLQDVTLEQWWDLVNARSYFFCKEADMEAFVDAYVSQGHGQEVLKLKTALALGPVLDRVEVTTVKASALPRIAKPSRGTETFQPLASFPAANMTKIQEITIVGDYALPWTAVTSVIERPADGTRKRLFP